ncbi:hypothetical protein CC85DRAFT_282184 [Cutaneotrichosporon oleaginosum]|uniref:Restriction of telomere capping protein 4 n=1 Tax=Cutaneotrichosporon oleaginosum TaxID=879819 RepID=A0A0J0XYC3_9TREE|nr:uncharacterized protein CC85DRAFT_282184 [Cutaneotrichosporon oleaginosum]KLT46045.1 hypothetical protein CC85DRAFT_282184 [Cutaneotrichosporon oleaginosum]TXT06738.1 hypothetical protein COLE_06069 [Cutaneotrichosporon oleaginosum]
MEANDVHSDPVVSPMSRGRGGSGHFYGGYGGHDRHNGYEGSSGRGGHSGHRNSGQKNSGKNSGHIDSSKGHNGSSSNGQRHSSQRRTWSSNAPSRAASTAARRASPEITCISSSGPTQKSAQAGTLGRIQAPAYQRVHATLNMARPPESPDILALGEGDFADDSPMPVKRAVKALHTVSTLGANQPKSKAKPKPKSTIGTRYELRSPSPSPTPTPVAAKTRRRSPAPLVSRKVRVTSSQKAKDSSEKAMAVSSSAPESKTKSKAVVGGKRKAGSQMSRTVTSSPPPAEPFDSSQTTPNGSVFFDIVKAVEAKAREEEEEKQHAKEMQQILDDALCVDVTQDTPRNRKLKEDEVREQEEYEEMRRIREQRSKKQSKANVFFEHAPQMAAEARRRRSLEAKSIALAETAQFAPKRRELGEDEKYCASFKNYRRRCDHCSEPWPMFPSADLCALQRRFAAIPSLSFRQTMALCTMHRAETNIIPLGIRDGFPQEIDFEDVDRRLERGWIAARLKKVAAKPEISKFYRRAKKEINQMGLAAWKDVAHQSNDKVLAYAQPGYYGDLGRAIMIMHFQNLIRWGHLILGASTAPLPETDFIVTVLVPESAVLLTMEDGGWDGHATKGEGWEDARAGAMDLCRRAGPYGYWRFRADGEGQRVLDKVRQAASSKKARLDRRTVDMREIAEGGEHDAILVGSSDTEQPDESDWGADEWDEVVQAVQTEQAEPADLDATPRARRLLSPSPPVGVQVQVQNETDTPRAQQQRTLRPKSGDSSDFGDWDEQLYVAGMDGV